ncbi:hypothetical protein GCM10022245_36440 [Streptomyces mayteni]
MAQLDQAAAGRHALHEFEGGDQILLVRGAWKHPGECLHAEIEDRPEFLITADAAAAYLRVIQHPSPSQALVRGVSWGCRSASLNALIDGNHLRRS